MNRPVTNDTASDDSATNDTATNDTATNDTAPNDSASNAHDPEGTGLEETAADHGSDHPTQDQESVPRAVATPPLVGDLEVSVRRIDEIVLESEYLRTGTDVSALVKSIASVGLIHPVTINRDGELLAGARRLEAVRELGWTEIPVHVIDRDALVQELISIDENLVRTPLKGLELEKSLNRGREIYEQLNPDANKVDISTEELSREEKAERKMQEEQDEDSFAAVTAEKTGLSKSVIKGAIKRDALASPAVKRARGEGGLNATQTNEIIKLEADTQEQVLPLVADKTAKDTRRIVAAAREGGIEAAVEESRKIVPLPKEYEQLRSPLKRVNRTMARILAEELRYDGPQREAIVNELRALEANLANYFRMMGVQ